MQRMLDVMVVFGRGQFLMVRSRALTIIIIYLLGKFLAEFVLYEITYQHPVPVLVYRIHY